ncbi:hypothetical protein ATANTOWER_020918 [Ataeniobius toweri]|uniref:Uncharacterized protein n=1 Tax=Ataeniobius toweri TaxID=208326 RepID=A0ABU7B1H9_9TELE|nr:hypothetical protein [Ataeniobius toweri]
MGVEVPHQNNRVPGRGTMQHPRQGCQAGQVLHTTARPVGRNDSQRPVPHPKAQGCDPLIHWGKPQHKTAELRGNKIAHTSSPTLIAGHSTVEESSASLEELGSRAHAVHGGKATISSQYLSPPRTSSGSPATSEVTFHFLRASISIRRSGY